MTDHIRRSTDTMDETKKKILSLIESTDGSTDKAFLLILLQMSDTLSQTTTSLTENTKATQHIAIKLDQHLTNFEKHTKEEEKLVNQGRGAWKVAAWGLSIVQGIMVWAVLEVISDMKQNRADHASFDKRITVMETRK